MIIKFSNNLVYIPLDGLTKYYNIFGICNKRRNDYGDKRINWMELS